MSRDISFQDPFGKRLRPDKYAGQDGGHIMTYPQKTNPPIQWGKKK